MSSRDFILGCFKPSMVTWFGPVCDWISSRLGVCCRVSRFVRSRVRGDGEISR